MKGLCFECQRSQGYGPIGVSVLNAAFFAGHLTCATSVLNTGVDIRERDDVSNVTPLYAAIRGKSTECVQLCLSLGARVYRDAFNGAFCALNAMTYEMMEVIPELVDGNLIDYLHDDLYFVIRSRRKTLCQCITLLTVRRTQVLPPDVIHTIVKHLWSMRFYSNTVSSRNTPSE